MRLKLLINSLFVLFVESVISTLVFLGIPEKYLDHRRWPFREKKWEEGGNIYQRIFNVKAWKHRLPELSDFFSKTFSKKKIEPRNQAYLEKYVAESCRAEMAHWSIIVLAFISVVVNDCVVSMLLVAIALNLPFIVIQRYNRPRIMRLLRQLNRRKSPYDEAGDDYAVDWQGQIVVSDDRAYQFQDYRGD
jgi:glycosyl-4,4'-diaponeurosporenoate acyltransferase